MAGMSWMLAVALRPLALLVIYMPLMALGLWLVRKMKDGPVKRLLLTNVGGSRKSEKSASGG